MTNSQATNQRPVQRRNEITGDRDLLGRLTAAVAGALRGFLRDDRPHYAAALAHYALFSLFPLLLVAAVVYAGVVPQIGSYRMPRGWCTGTFGIRGWFSRR